MGSSQSKDDEKKKPGRRGSRVSFRDLGSIVWKVHATADEAKKKFVEDGTLNPNSSDGHLELRAMLDEPLSHQSLGAFAKETQYLGVFMCWIDINEYKAIPTKDYRRSKALHIYHKYIKQGSILEVSMIIRI
jgi:hypothetical protein